MLLPLTKLCIRWQSGEIFLIHWSSPLDRAVVRAICSACRTKCPSNYCIQLPPFAKANKCNDVRLIEHTGHVAWPLQMCRTALPEVLECSLDRNGKVRSAHTHRYKAVWRTHSFRRNYEHNASPAHRCAPSNLEHRTCRAYGGQNLLLGLGTVAAHTQ